MAKKISEKIIDILQEATIDKSENSLTLNRELDRKDYLGVDEVLLTWMIMSELCKDGLKKPNLMMPVNG